MKSLPITLVICFLAMGAYAQNPPILYKCQGNLYHLRDSVENIAKNYEDPYTLKGYKHYRRLLRLCENAVYPSGNILLHNRYLDELKFLPPPEPAAGRSVNWTYIPSTGNADIGRTGSVAFDPTDPNKFYVCTPNSGVWLSADNGNSYTPITEDLPTLSTVALLVHPGNPNRLVLATGHDNNDLPPNSMGVYVSNDGGSTWQPSSLSFAAQQGAMIYEMVRNPLNPQSLLLASTQGLYRSTDGGDNWLLLQPGPHRGVAYKPNDSTTVYAVTTVPQKSTDNGLSFTPMTGGIHTNLLYSAHMVKTTAADPDRVYVTSWGWTPNLSMHKTYIQSSTNAGGSFTTVDSLVNDGFNLAVSQQNANKVISGYYRVYQRNLAPFAPITVSSGAVANYVHVDQRGIFYHPQNDNTLYLCHDGGLSRSTDGGLTFQNITANMQLAHLYDFAQSTANGDKIITSSLDVPPYMLGGTGITQTFPFVEGWSSFMNWKNDSIFYQGARYTGDYHYYTFNNGGTFSFTPGPMYSPSKDPKNFLIDPCNPARVYFGHLNQVYQSANHGQNYALIGNTNHFDLDWNNYQMQHLAVARTNKNVVYALYRLKVYKTVNGGSTWTDVTGTLPVGPAGMTFILIDPLDEERVWIAFSGYNSGNKVFQSEDGAQTWTNISTGIPNVPINWMAYHEGSDDGIYLAADGAVFYKDNSLSAWQFHNTDLPPVRVTSIEIQNGIQKIRASTFGRGMWECNLYDPVPGYQLPPLANFEMDTAYICAGASVSFTEDVCGTYTDLQWEFQGGVPSTSTSPTPTVVYNATGMFTVTLIASNGSTADTLVRQQLVQVVPPLPLPYQQSVPITGGISLPYGVSTEDLNGDGNAWQKETAFGYMSDIGDYCFRYNNYDFDLNQETEPLRMPPLQLSTHQNALLTFWRSYGRRDFVATDSLLVTVQTCDGGAEVIYRKGGSQLMTTPDLFQYQPYTPFGPVINDYWRKDSVDFSQFAGLDNVVLTFHNKGNHGQMVYIDEIKVEDVNTLPPYTQFSHAANSYCGEALVQFTDNSLYQPTAWVWSFPGGTPASSTAQNPPPVQYASPGTYFVSLNTANANGNGNAFSTTVTVYPLPPEPTLAFNAGNVSCTPTGPQYSYTWYYHTDTVGLFTAPHLVPGSNTSTLPMDNNGYYGVTVTDSNGCSNSNQIFVVDYSTLAESAGSIPFLVFPNPAQQSITVLYGFANDERFSIHNSLGQEVMQGLLPTGKQILQLDIGHLAKGVYVIETGKRQTKFIKQ